MSELRAVSLCRHFALQNPTVLSVNSICANVGDKFVIDGTGIYPSLVTGVAIGGMPLDRSQYSKMSDTLIQVTAPDESGGIPCR